MKILLRWAALASSVFFLIVSLDTCNRSTDDNSEESISSAPIAVGSTLIADIVRDLSEGRFAPHNLVPPGMCPAHCDMRPGDIERVASSKVVLVHPWQRDAANITKLVEAANLPRERMFIVDVAGNWLAPPVHCKAVEAIGSKLAELDESNAAVYDGQHNNTGRSDQATQQASEGKTG